MCLLSLAFHVLKLEIQLTGPSSLSEFLKLPAVGARDNPAAAFLSPPSAKQLN
jgi:hypothetical protein